MQNLKANHLRTGLLAATALLALTGCDQQAETQTPETAPEAAQITPLAPAQENMREEIAVPVEVGTASNPAGDMGTTAQTQVRPAADRKAKAVVTKPSSSVPMPAKTAEPVTAPPPADPHAGHDMQSMSDFSRSRPRL